MKVVLSKEEEVPEF